MRVLFGMWAMVFLRWAAPIAFRTFRFAAFRCLLVTTGDTSFGAPWYLPASCAHHASAAETRCTTAFTMSGPCGMRASTFVKPKPIAARPTRTTTKSM